MPTIIRFLGFSKIDNPNRNLHPNPIEIGQLLWESNAVEPATTMIPMGRISPVWIMDKPGNQ